MQPTIQTAPELLNCSDSLSITQKSKSNFSSSFVFLPQEKRQAIRHVYAFFRVIDDVVDEEKDKVKQKHLIDSWKRELENTYKGTTIVPLLKELQISIERFQIPQEYFFKLIEGCEMDITKNRYETFDELYGYCYRVASMVGLVCMKIFEYQSPTSDQTAISLGIALQLTNIIRDVGVDLEKGRIYLPEEDLKKFKVSESDLFNKKVTPQFLELMNNYYMKAENYYKHGITEFKNDSEKKLLAAKIMSTVYKEILEKIKKKNFPVLNKRVRLNYFKKMQLLGKVLTTHYLI